MQTANTILAQLGGNKFLAMTGASNLIGRPDGLSFKVGRNDAKVTHVRVTLTPADEYTVEFINVRGVNVKPLATVEHVQADNLARVFETKTGMRVSL
jgi:hypothetical protein